MIIRKTTVLVLATAGLAACGSGSVTRLEVTPEQRAANSPSRCLLSPFIRNADGSIDYAQMQAGIDASFAAADLNRDGRLTYDEIAIVNQQRQGTCDQTSLVSWDGTGTIGRQEYGSRYETAFIAADRDLDGVATSFELDTPVSPTERAIADYKRSQERKASPASARSDGLPGSMPNTNRGY